MSDDLKDRGGRDRSRVNVNEFWEVEYWTKVLDISEAALREAVTAAGVSAEKVRAYVEKMRSRRLNDTAA